MNGFDIYKAIIVVIILLIVAGLIYIVISCHEEQESLAKSIPLIPQRLTGKSTSTTITLTWEDISKNELGFHIFRDGILVANTAQDTYTYKDVGLNVSTIYEYCVVAYNKNGESPEAKLTVKTKNYSLVVWLEKIGVIDNGEDFIREIFGQSEIYIGIVVTDGIKIQNISLPFTGFFHLKDNGEESVNLPIFYTDDVGSYLKINVIGFENDSFGFIQGLLIKAMDFAVKEIMFGTLYSIALDVLGVDFTGAIVEIGGFKDDYLGEYSCQWNQSDNWGVGYYQDVRAQDKNDGLRLWFTIKLSSP